MVHSTYLYTGIKLDVEVVGIDAGPLPSLSHRALGIPHQARLFIFQMLKKAYNNSIILFIL